MNNLHLSRREEGEGVGKVTGKEVGLKKGKAIMELTKGQGEPSSRTKQQISSGGDNYG